MFAFPVCMGEFRRCCCGFQCREAVFQMQRSHWLFFLHHISREPLNHGSVPERWKSVLNCMPPFYPISVELKSMCGVLYPRSLFLDRVRSTIAKCRCRAPAQFLTVMPAVWGRFLEWTCAVQGPVRYVTNPAETGMGTGGV